MILFIISLFLGYYGVISNPPASGTDYNIGIVVSVVVILVLFALHEYLHL